MKKQQERARRLAIRRKEELMTKDEEQKSMYLEVKQREQKLVDFRYKNQVQKIVESSDFDKKLGNWVRKGFPNSKDIADFSSLEKKFESSAGNLHSRKNS